MRRCGRERRRHARSGGHGVELYRAVRDDRPALPFVFFTGRPAGWLSERVDLRADPAAAVRTIEWFCR
ncbi:hypothetical protein BRC93_16705 [Halobacteriales archaeon QS_5_70_15]|nr:MAG: hypothetical protein BRC93_16705 [Halobacteriales archaeon QS_5_70_15]